MIKFILSLFQRKKNLNDRIDSYEKVCTFGINPDALINEKTRT